MMQQPGAGGVAPSPSMAADQSQNQQYQQQPQPWMMMSQKKQQASQHVPPPSGRNPQSVTPPSQMQQYSGSAAGGSEEIRSLWIGDLQPWMDENYLINIFSQSGEVLSAKVIRNKQTGLPKGYGFIEFVSRVAAERLLQSYNGVPMPNSE